MAGSSDHSRELEVIFIRRLQARDEAAFSELIDLYERRVFALIYRMVGRRDEAEDLTQDVFLQAFRAIDRFRGDAKLSTWLFRVAVNLTKNRLKYTARRGGDAKQDVDALNDRSSFGQAQGVSVGGVDRPDELVQGMQLEQIVRRAMMELEPDFRQLVVLRDVEDLTYDEIAAVTGLPKGTVKSRIHRGRAQLKQRVERLLGSKLRKKK